MILELDTCGDFWNRLHTNPFISSIDLGLYIFVSNQMMMVMAVAVVIAIAMSMEQT